MENIFKVKGLNLKDVEYDKDGYLIENKGNIRKTITCLRPGHKSGLPKVYAECKNGKYISHDYGHSGVGYSIMFGTINQSIDNLLKLKKDFSTNKNAEITVLGLGCIGLYTALKLYSLGYKNIKLVGENFENIPSQWAGGLFEFSLNTIVKKETINYLNELFLTSFYEYQKIAEKTHNILSEGVKMVDYFTDFFAEGIGLPYLSDVGLIPKMRSITLEIEGNKSQKLNLYYFKTFHIITGIFMDHMMQKIKEFKIPVEFKKINSFNEINSEIIFNCTGLGSKELNSDPEVYPVCGHGFVMNDNLIAKHDYILRLGEVPGLKSNPVGGSLYFMPKTSGFIGGTYLKGYDGSDEEYNKYQITSLLERAKYLFNEILDATRVENLSKKTKYLKPKF